MDDQSLTLERERDQYRPEREPWRWRDLRDVGLGIELWPLNWCWPKWGKSGDSAGIRCWLNVGPFCLSFMGNPWTGVFGRRFPKDEADG